jgi:hypothetical protein
MIGHCIVEEIFRFSTRYYSTFRPRDVRKVKITGDDYFLVRTASPLQELFKREKPFLGRIWKSVTASYKSLLVFARTTLNANDFKIRVLINGHLFNFSKREILNSDKKPTISFMFSIDTKYVVVMRKNFFVEMFVR